MIPAPLQAAHSGRPPEEWANAVTHALGALVTIAVAPMIVASRAPPVRGALTIFLASMVAVFVASAVYHWLLDARAKRIFLAIDHVAIYGLIAGTYTAIAAAALPVASRDALTLLIWLMAGTGIAVALAAFASGRDAVYERHCYPLHLLMGWGPIVFYGREVRAGLSPSAGLLILAGCLAYSGGVAIYRLSRSRWGHACWHVAVMAGAALHVMAVTWP